MSQFHENQGVNDDGTFIPNNSIVLSWPSTFAAFPILKQKNRGTLEIRLRFLLMGGPEGKIFGCNLQQNMTGNAL